MCATPPQSLLRFYPWGTSPILPSASSTTSPPLTAGNTPVSARSLVAPSTTNQPSPCPTHPSTFPTTPLCHPLQLLNHNWPHLHNDHSLPILLLTSLEGAQILMQLSSELWPRALSPLSGPERTIISRKQHTSSPPLRTCNSRWSSSPTPMKWPQKATLRTTIVSLPSPSPSQALTAFSTQQNGSNSQKMARWSGIARFKAPQTCPPFQKCTSAHPTTALTPMNLCPVGVMNDLLLLVVRPGITRRVLKMMDHNEEDKDTKGQHSDQDLKQYEITGCGTTQ